MHMQNTYSAAELAALAIPCLPDTERRVREIANREMWPNLREPVKGGYEKRYIVALLPDAVRAALTTRTAKKVAGQGAGAGQEQVRMLAEQTARQTEEARLAREQGLALYRTLPANKKAFADARYEILQARDAFLATAKLPVKSGSQMFCCCYNDGTLPIGEQIRQIIGANLSWSTINRWAKAYQASGMIGLAPAHRNPQKGTSTVPEPMKDLIVGLIVAHPRIMLSRVMDALAARFAGQALPRESAVRRYMAAYKKAEAGTLLAISNPDTWRSRRQLAFGSASEQIERLNQMWEFDGTKGDVMLTDGRHCVIGVIDIYSRRLKLLVSKTNKSTAVAALTRAAILDWGMPEVARTDNGSDYTSAHMVRVFDGLGIGWDLCDPFQPQQKPHIERVFRTFSHGIVELMPGFVGHSVADRKDIEARKSFAQRLMEGGAPAEANMTAAEFQDLCDRWCAAIYHQDAHDGLGGRKPIEMVRAWRQPIRRISDQRVLDCLLAEAPDGNGLRTVTKKGVQVHNIWYQAPEFGAVVDQFRKVRVLLDAADLGQVHCYLPETGEFFCVAVDPIRKGIDRAEMAAKGRAIQKQVMSDGTRALKRLARETAADGIYQEILSHRESLIANTVDLPKLAHEYTTPALDEAALAAEALAGKRKEPIRLTPEEYRKSEIILADFGRKSGIRLAMPGSNSEAYEMLLAEREQGLELSFDEGRWMAEYERFLDTGKRVGLMAEGWQPYAARAKIAREASGK